MVGDEKRGEDGERGEVPGSGAGAGGRGSGMRRVGDEKREEDGERGVWIGI
jgi:hypothetical protein